MSSRKDQMISGYLAQLNRRLQVVENRLGIISLTEQEGKELEKSSTTAIQHFWGDGVQIKKLTCGLEIAMEDYWEWEDGSKKTEFTFDEALKIEKKTGGKWRVPAIKEWLQIVLELGTTEDGDLDRDKFVKELNLIGDEDGYGFYWSSAVRDGSLAYGLYYNSTELYPADRDGRSVGRSVRLVRE